MMYRKALCIQDRGAAAKTQQEWISTEVANVAAHGYAPVLQRNWDATANRMAFGALQYLVAPHARYSVRDDNGEWSIVRYAELKQKFEVARFRILDLLAQGGILHW